LDILASFGGTHTHEADRNTVPIISTIPLV